MKDYYPLHVVITDETMKVISKHKVVFPAYYGKVYTKLAKKYKVELSPIELLHNEMLDEKIVRHIVSLAEYTDIAIEAISKEDREKLNLVLQETKKLREEIEELQILVYEDSLTKCFNRKWFEDKFLKDDKITFSKNGTMVFVDLNRLKRINDQYGHIVGDKVIKYLALKLKEITKNIVRFGGDEFILLFDEYSEDVEIKMQEFYNFFRKTKFKSEDIEFTATFAYGLCSFKEGENLSGVLNIADKNMYIYKKGARGKKNG